MFFGQLGTNIICPLHLLPGNSDSTVIWLATGFNVLVAYFIIPALVTKSSLAYFSDFGC